MSIQQEAAAYKAKAQEMLGEKFSMITGDMERVRASDTLDHVLKTGQNVPDFTLPDAFGHQVSLKALLTQGPVVISFYRGEWCPFCNIELRGLQAMQPLLRELGASLVAITPEKPDYGAVATEKNQLTFPILTDFGNQVARQFGIVYEIGEELRNFSKDVFKNDLATRNADGSYDLPVPATFVVDPTNVIRFAHADVDYMLGRAEPETVLEAVRTIAHPVAH